MPADSGAGGPVLVEQHGPAALLTLNRPGRLNAISHELAATLRRRIGELGQDDGVRAIVLTGQGRGFCSGADLRAATPGTDAEAVLRSYYNPLILDMMALGKPLIAAVNGVAAGAGVSLALACDLRVAAESASFQMSFTKVGLVPDGGASWLLPRAIGTARAAEMALLARRVTARQAADWGLVNEVTPDDAVRDRALALAQEAASLSSSAGATRRLLHESLAVSLADQLDAEATAQGKAQRQPDFAEAIAAFAEKRPPRFG